MKKICFALIFTLFLIASFAFNNHLFGQGVFHIGEKPLKDTIIIPNDKLIYVIPDSLEKSLSHTLDSNGNYYSAFVLISATNNLNSNIIGLSVICDYMLQCEDIGISVFKLTESSNRFLLIKNKFYPILFDSDLLLSDFRESHNNVKTLVDCVILKAKHNKLYIEFNYNYLVQNRQ